jgi:hypothetical protein
VFLTHFFFFALGDVALGDEIFLTGALDDIVFLVLSYISSYINLKKQLDGIIYAATSYRLTNVIPANEHK